MPNLTPSTIVLSSGHQLAVSEADAKRVADAIASGKPEALEVRGRFITETQVQRNHGPGGRGDEFYLVPAHVVAILA